MPPFSIEGFDFKLVTLGVPRLDITERVTGAAYCVAAGKSLALITYLAFAPRRTVARDTLCDLLWGDRGVEKSRPLLRQTLWLIKSQICSDFIAPTGESISLVLPLACDADEFTRAIEADDLKLAVSLYGGDFFSGYAAPGARRFEEWASLERTRYRGLFMYAAEALARRRIDSAKLAEAVAIANRMRAIDPNSQTGWRILLEARTASGDRIAARADADQFEEWLRQEEWEPEPASLVAINAARRTAALYDSGDSSRELTAELVGREKEFSQIIDAWTATQNRGARVVHVIGESGGGKTRLTRDVLARIRASRGKSRYVRANFAERQIAFSFAAAIAERLSSTEGAGGIAPAAARTLVSLNPALSSRYPELAGTAEPVTALRVGLALLEMIASIADESPVAIVLEDMHWWDASSREALTIVGSRLASEKVLLITTSSLQHNAVPISSNEIKVRLHPLSESDITALVMSLARLPEADRLRGLPAALCTASGGNPLRVIEALRFAIDANLLMRVDEQWLAPDPPALITALEKTSVMERRIARMSPDERSILILIGAAGAPVPQPIVLAASGISETHAVQTIAGLEQRGLVILEDGALLPSHDTVRDAITSDASPDEICLARSRLGHAFAASEDVQERRRSIGLLASADQWADAARNVRPLLEGMALSGAQLDLHLQALLGPASTLSNVTRLRRELPFTVRHPTFFRAAVLAAVPVVLILGGFVIPRLRATSLPDTELAVVSASENGAINISTAALDIDHWMPETKLGFRRRSANIPIDVPSHAAPRPTTESWARYKVYPDSGAGDIELIDIRGRRERITRTPGDDRPSSFSPDGKQLLFLTTRWSRLGWSDVAILDLASSRVTRVTHGGRKYAAASWSPDGTRISYTTEPTASESAEICIANADGTASRCDVDGSWTNYSHGWVDDRRLLISGGSRGTQGYRFYDVDSRSSVDVAVPERTIIRVDPSGLWILASMPGRKQIAVSPTTRPDLIHLIKSGNETLREVFFLAPHFPHLALDSVTIAKRRAPLSPMVPSRLRPIGWRHDGTRSTPRAGRWINHSPRVATIDSIGVITPTDTGIAIIEFSAGGWRSVIDTFVVRRAETRALLTERWDSAVPARWRTFGDPRPTIVHHHGRNAFLNNGDGLFFSGAYLREPLDPSFGLAVDFQASTPLTRTQWQLLTVWMRKFPENEQLRNWDHRTGYLPLELGELGDRGCRFTYPEGEGDSAATSSPWFRSLRNAMGDPAFRLDRGEWYSVRLQLFPGGRCGLAINGKPIFITDSDGTDSNSASPGRVMLLLQGHSVGSRMVVGPLTITRGVPIDINWTKLQYDGVTWGNK